MKKLTSKEKNLAAKALLKRIEDLYNPAETVRIMEVCGTHTVAIFREGIRQLLPAGIELVSGPGCPVCVTDQIYMDKALAYAKMDDVVLATFGDMLKVPGSYSSLREEKAKGAHIEVVYSPLEVLDLGRQYPHKRIVFLAIGFETTIATIAATVKGVYAAGLSNVFFLVSHKLVPPALRALLTQKEGHIDGFLLPGHVSVIVGEEPYQFVPREYGVPCAIVGFDGVEILGGVASILEQRRDHTPKIDNQYKEVVYSKGNPVALQLMEELYEVRDDAWRGMGVIPNSGLALRAPYDVLDVEKMIPLKTGELVTAPPTGCQCGRVLQGLITPTQCPLFGTVCTPDHAVGACMVSVEGSCAAWYAYGNRSGGFAWEEVT